ncbi:MAG: alkaline phosphatase D family protein [Bacteroidota bacterium]
MKTNHLLLSLALLAIGSTARAQQSFLQSGPMLGYSEMREVMLWVQTNATATVHFTYREKGKKSPEYHTASVKTEKTRGYAAHCLADQVEPGKDYEATLFINDQAISLPYPVEFHARDLWQWRTEPPAFKFVIGSCAYHPDPTYDRPGKPYGGDEQIFKHILDQEPDLMIWLGDNMYLREADWNTMTGIHYRYTRSRSLEVLQPLLARVHHYAIWDDHDYGPNNSDQSFIHREKTLAAFKHFWANPTYGVLGESGVTTQFSWSDCDFFLLDNRYFRSAANRTTGKRTMLGEHQIEWLLDALKASQATFKFVCIGGMVLSEAAMYENYIALYPQERKHLLEAIQKDGISGVIFLDGDRHHTELSKWSPEGQFTIYDVTISPLTSGAHQGDGGKNALLVEGTEVAERNFATLEVTGPREDRLLTIRVFNMNGEEKWEYEIRAKELHKK